jgi:hypothetical protein
VHLPDSTASIQNTTIQDFPHFESLSSHLKSPIYHTVSEIIQTTYCQALGFFKTHEHVFRIAIYLTPRCKTREPKRTTGTSRPKIDRGCQQKVGGFCAGLCRGRSCAPPVPRCQPRPTR